MKKHVFSIRENKSLLRKETFPRYVNFLLKNCLSKGKRLNSPTRFVLKEIPRKNLNWWRSVLGKLNCIDFGSFCWNKSFMEIVDIGNGMRHARSGSSSRAFFWKENWYHWCNKNKHAKPISLFLNRFFPVSTFCVFRCFRCSLFAALRISIWD